MDVEMPKTASTYESKQLNSAGWIDYSADENKVWKDLYDRQVKLLPHRVSHEFRDGLEKLNLTKDKIPQLREVNANLAKCSGFGVEAVPALITPRTFLHFYQNGNSRLQLL